MRSCRNDLDIPVLEPKRASLTIALIKKVPPQGAGYGNRLLANRWFPLQVYIFRPKGRGITPILD